MKLKPTIAIIIPAHNESKNIKACLDSIAGQTRPPDEVFVVDNNSTDGTTEIAIKYRFVTILSETRQGIVFARNAGFDAATSDIVCRIDSDTRMPPDWVETVEKHFGRGGKAVTGPVRFYDVPLKRFIQWLHTLLYFKYTRLTHGYYLLAGANMAITRALWKEVEDEICARSDIHEDMDLSLHIIKSAKIDFEPALLQNASMQSGKKGILYAWYYAQLWPRTFRHEGLMKYGIAWISTLVVFALLTPLIIVAGIQETLYKSNKISQK